MAWILRGYPMLSFLLAFLGIFLTNAPLLHAQLLPRLLVRYSDAVDPADQTRALEDSFPLRLHKSLPTLNIHIFEAEGLLPGLLAALLSTVSGIVWVELDQTISAAAEPDDPFFERQWYLNDGAVDIGVEEAWAMVTEIEGPKIAILDSGCDLEHPDVAPNLWRNPGEIPGNGRDDDNDGYVDDVFGYDFVNSRPDPADNNSHGTRVFGIVAGAGNNGVGISGMIWSGEVMCLKVLGRDAVGWTSDAVEAFDYAIAHDAKILNLSWGSISFSLLSQALEEAIQAADEAGILVVASAGNGAVQIDIDLLGIGHFPSSFPQPNIIAVASTNESDELADHSDWGKNDVDLGAPGEALYTSDLGGGYVSFKGTSAAAPVVTGAAALVWSANPQLSHIEIKRLILDSVDPVPGLGGKVLSNGRVNVAQALRAAPSGLRMKEGPSGAGPEKEPGQGPSGEAAAGAGGCSLQVR